MTSVATCRRFPFADNVLGQTGPATVLGELSFLKKLRSLNLAHNDMGDVGARSLARTLPLLKKLRTLSVHGNNIGMEGARKLAKSIVHVKKLENLDAGSNDFGELNGRHERGDLEVGKALPLEVEGPIRKEPSEEGKEPEIEVGKAPVDRNTPRVRLLCRD